MSEGEAPKPARVGRFVGRAGVRLVVDTRNLKAVCAHRHAGVVHAVEQVLLSAPGLLGTEIFKGSHVHRGRDLRHYLLTRAGLEATLRRLHSVPGHPLAEVAAKYALAFSMAEADEKSARASVRRDFRAADPAPEPEPEPAPEPAPEPEPPVPPVPEPAPPGEVVSPLSVPLSLLAVSMSSSACCLRLLVHGPVWDRRAEALEKWAAELRAPAPAAGERH